MMIKLTEKEKEAIEKKKRTAYINEKTKIEVAKAKEKAKSDDTPPLIAFFKWIWGLFDND
jgi:hypothetical protein